MVPLPMYNGFDVDVPTRNGAVVLEVPFQHLEGYRDLDDVFKPELNRMAFDSAMERAKKNGIKVRGVLVCKYVKNRAPDSLLSIRFACILMLSLTILFFPVRTIRWEDAT